MGGGEPQELEGVRKTTGSSIGGSSLVPTRAELEARTVAAGGDHQSTTPGLIPRIHERLLGEHNARGSGRGGGGRGNRAADGGPTGVRERQTFMRGGERGGCDSSVTSDFAGGGGGAAAAEWRLCDQRTKHCTQRGSHGSGFSCGYRNIQMLCSALMEWPEYKRSGTVVSQSHRFV
ncbi:unnamed protein product [Ectocarpus sp. CCAP 1310/34]|nr:unnamed protein product [Ectocarpus sp. CCAP 1310/34]